MALRLILSQKKAFEDVRDFCKYNFFATKCKAYDDKKPCNCDTCPIIRKFREDTK